MFAITERLLLRPGWAEDAAALVPAINDLAIARNTARIPFPYTPGDAESFLAAPVDPLRPHFLIFRRDDSRLVGGIGLQGEAVAELGYWIARDFWGLGYATEAGRAVIALADESLRLPRLVASHGLDNPASGKVLAKLGFTPGGLGRVHSLARDADLDVRLFARERRADRARLLAA